MPSSITGRSSPRTVSASSARRCGGIVTPSGLCRVGWTYSARTGALAASAAGTRPYASVSIGTSSMPSRVAAALTTGYVRDSTASRSPVGTNAARAAAMPCRPFPATSTDSGSGVQDPRASIATAASRTALVLTAPSGCSASVKTSARSTGSSACASLADWVGSTAKLSSRSTRASPGSESAGSGPGLAARTKVPRPTSPIARPRRTSSPYTRAAVEPAMPRSRANRRCGGSRSPGRSHGFDVGGEFVRDDAVVVHPTLALPGFSRTHHGTGRSLFANATRGTPRTGVTRLALPVWH